ncbi:SRPBCC domain-containing protein [Streptomyces sp. NPDC058231]|uniref:SRPBCC domain-containing protein n=1 Tax=Streptomyces sp. NPDC058231 TaxID=3346392 RepID=UPI0036E4ECEC
MTDAHSVIERGTTETRGDEHVLRFTLRLPHPVPRVWAAVASSEGLARWLGAADPFEPYIGGAVTLRLAPAGQETEVRTVSGTVTAWDVERVAEYTLDSGRGRTRFHLEPPRGEDVVLRFTNEFRGDDARRLDRLTDWHSRFERLAAALDGEAAAGPDRPPAGWRELRESYGADDGGKQF